MKLTNKFNLPEPIVNAIKSFQDDYKSDLGDTEYSVTGLIKPPLMRQLEIAHEAEIERDVSDMLFILMGSATHLVLEKASADNALVEERLFADVHGVKISGKADLYTASDATVWDYKITSTYKVADKDPDPDWVAQLNVLGYLYRSHGFNVERLRVCAILRDWGQRLADKAPCAFKEFPVPMWSDEKTVAYINERIRLHKIAESQLVEAIQPCTPEERWESPKVWAVMKRNRKSAIKLCANPIDADLLASELGSEHYVEERTSKPRRCMDYCAVSRFCPNYTGEGVEYGEQ